MLNECYQCRQVQEDNDEPYRCSGCGAWNQSQRFKNSSGAVAEPILTEILKAAISNGPSKEWLRKAADAEDQARSISVGGLATELNLDGDKQ